MGMKVMNAYIPAQDPTHARTTVKTVWWNIEKKENEANEEE
jgi:hypothetical protein